MAITTWMLRFVRRILGTAQMLEQQEWLERRSERRHQQQIKLMLTLGNAVRYSQATPEALASTPLYQRCASIISLLTPMGVAGGAFIRVGRHHDGGYVMLDVFEQHDVEAAYGFGISTDSSWDEAIADRGIDVLMFDHTVPPPPRLPARCRAFRIGLTGRRTGPMLRTLSALVAEHGHRGSRRLIMKMDIEGCEWDVFDETPSEVLGQFSQIVVELHGLMAAVHDPDTLSRYCRILQKLNHTHQVVHVHANGGGLPLWVGPLVLPDRLETTYLRRADFAGRFVRDGRRFPTAIDEPSVAGWSDVDLGTFSVGDEAVP